VLDISANDKCNFEHDGFLIVDKLIEPSRIPSLKKAFDDLFNGRFETGVQPDEVNWQQQNGDPGVTRQICNGWKSNRAIGNVIFDQRIGEAIARLAGGRGLRVMIDNVIWKPVGAKSLGYHQDSSYLAWFTPSDLLTCWIALDDTSEEGGTLEFIRGSHRWNLSPPEGEFHAPQDYRNPMEKAAARQGVDPEVCYVEVPAGGGSFHHGWTWHGSGENRGNKPRRAVVVHAMQSDVEYVPENFNQGIGPIYSRYKRLADNSLDENYFPVTWHENGYRTPQIENYLKGVQATSV
jgi:ectoine hydroxylase-related dioxygenase (phytanoyl-CoA dioxygenase family)